MRNIDYKLTLMDSAQVFHWHETASGYAAVVNGRVLTDKSCDSEASHYFDDERDYSVLAYECASFSRARESVNLLPGLKVLNQPPWEALIAFILSANNNVKRIRNLVLKLCAEYGSKYEHEGLKLYGFPTAETLASLDPNELKKRVTCGYRAEYLVETAKMVADGFKLEEIKNLPLKEARSELMRLKGVGPKVADCVLLFGCEHADAFPVDVWVQRLMESWFGVTGSAQKVSDKARELLGPNCGLIQQALFHAARCGLLEL